MELYRFQTNCTFAMIHELKQWAIQKRDRIGALV